MGFCFGTLGRPERPVKEVIRDGIYPYSMLKDNGFVRIVVGDKKLEEKGGAT